MLFFFSLRFTEKGDTEQELNTGIVDQTYKMAASDLASRRRRFQLSYKRLSYSPIFYQNGDDRDSTALTTTRFSVQLQPFDKNATVLQENRGNVYSIDVRLKPFPLSGPLTPDYEEFLAKNLLATCTCRVQWPIVYRGGYVLKITRNR